MPRFSALRCWQFCGSPCRKQAATSPEYISSDETEDSVITRSIPLLFICGVEVRILNPDRSEGLRQWENLNMIALLFIAAVTPYEAALLDTRLNVIFFINRFIDFIFITNMFLSFIVMYPVKTRFGHILVTNPRLIARNYLRGWFVIDLLSILPFDSLGLFLDNDQLKDMKVIKIVRLLRLLKLVRVLKANRVFKKWETTMSITHANLSLGKFLVAIIVCGHWFGCLWAMVGMSMQGPSYTNPYLELVELPSNGHINWIQVFCQCPTCEVDCNTCKTCLVDHFGIYSAALHFSVMTLTSIGYGDIVPTYKEERVMGCLLMLFSGVLWAYIIGSACGVIANMDKHEQTFKQTIDDLNYMVRDKQLPTEVRHRLRVYFYQTKDVVRRGSYKEIINQLSPSLQGEVALLVNKSLVQKIWYLKEASEHMLVGFAQALDARVFAQGELFGETRVLYILSRGLVGRKGRILRYSAVWGEDFILNCDGLLDYTKSVAFTYVEITWMNRHSLDIILEQFPDEKPNIRKAQVRLAFQRAVIVIAEMCRTRHSRGDKWFGVQDVTTSEKGIPLTKSYKDVRATSSESFEMMRIWKSEVREFHKNMQQMNAQSLMGSQGFSTNFDEMSHSLRASISSCDKKLVDLRGDVFDVRDQLTDDINLLREDVASLRCEIGVSGVQRLETGHRLPRARRATSQIDGSVLVD